MPKRTANLFMPIAILVCLALSGRAETIVIDDFNDGNDDGWIHVDLLGEQPGGPGIYDVSSGEYNIRSTDVVPAEVFGPIASLWAGSADPAFSDGVLRATLRTNSAGAATNLLMRFGMAQSGAGAGGYSLSMGTPSVVGTPLESDFAFVVIQGNEAVRFVPFDIPGVTVNTGENWIVEMGAIGDQISLKAWPEAGSEPEAPQIVVTDSTYSTGMFGIGAFRDPNFLSEDWETNGTFDDISFTLGFPPGIHGNPGLVNPGLGGNLPPGLADGLPGQSAHSVPEPASALSVLVGLGLLCWATRKNARDL